MELGAVPQCLHNVDLNEALHSHYFAWQKGVAIRALEALGVVLQEGGQGTPEIDGVRGAKAGSSRLSRVMVAIYGIFGQAAQLHVLAGCQHK